jgi:hypothetical protein
MARLSEVPEATFTALQHIRETCLIQYDSLFTPHRKLWSIENLRQFHASFVERFDEGEGNFLEKWRKQLAGANDDILQLAAELLYVQPGGLGNDTHANFNYNFSTQIRSEDGHDSIFGFDPGRSTLTLHGTSGTVNPANFSTYFTVSDPAGSAGVVITDNQGDSWSVQLMGVHDTAQQLLNEGVFVFA